MNNALEREQWCQRTTEEETIVALQAQVKKLLLSARADKKGGKEEGKSKVWSRHLIGKEAPPTSGRRLRQRKVNQPQKARGWKGMALVLQIQGINQAQGIGIQGN
jgi:hypothetical protein